LAHQSFQVFTMNEYDEASGYMVEQEEESLVTRLLLRVHAANLPRVGILKSHPDSFAVVTSVHGRVSRSGPYYNNDSSIGSGTLSW
jgi:hypothetical protein